MQDRSIKNSEVLCECFGVTRADVEGALRLFSADNADKVMRYTEAGSGCMSCKCAIRKFIEQKNNQVSEFELV